MVVDILDACPSVCPSVHRCRATFKMIKNKESTKHEGPLRSIRFDYFVVTDVVVVVVVVVVVRITPSV